MRQRRRAATPAPGGLRHLADLGLREQHDVERDLLDRARRDGQRRAELGRPHAVGVPRQRRLGELELGGEAPQHGQAVVAERGQRAGRAAELDGEARPGADEPLARLDERDEPARGLEAEGRRQRLLEQRAAGHERGTVLARQAGARGRGAVEVAEHEL